MLVVTLVASGCFHQNLEAPTPEDPFYLSMDEQAEIKKLKDRLMQNDQARSDFDWTAFLDAADWTKVRRINLPNRDMAVYGMPIDNATGAFLDNLIVFEKEGMLYPVLLSYEPTDDWLLSEAYRMSHLVDGQLRISTLDETEAWHSVTTGANARSSSMDCTVIMVEVVPGGWLTVGEGEEASTHYIQPELAPVTICEQNGGGGMFGDEILGNGTGGNDGLSAPQDTVIVPLVPEDVLTDCEKLKKLMENSTYTALLTDLMIKTNADREYAFMMQINARQTLVHQLMGEPGVHEINLALEYPIDVFVHSHYEGGSSIFSDMDVATLYKLYSTDMIRDPNTFTYGVITKQGTLYQLMIHDEQKFQAFGNGAFSNPVSQEFFEMQYKEYEIHHENNTGVNELGFLQFILEQDTGLSLYQGNATDFGEIKNLTLLDPDTPISILCLD